MEHSFIPTLKEVKKVQITKLIEEIRRQPVNEDAIEILKGMEEEMDIARVHIKLISMLLDQYNVSGPDRIGIDRKRLESILRPSPERNRGSARPYRGKPGFAAKRPSRPYSGRPSPR
jgi:ATP-dependent RNA helicase DeaD